MDLILLDPRGYICHLTDFSQRKNKWRFMESNVVVFFLFFSVPMSNLSLRKFSHDCLHSKAALVPPNGCKKIALVFKLNC